MSVSWPLVGRRGASMLVNPYSAALAWLEPLASAFGARIWRGALALTAGAILAQGPRTVASALRAVGLGAARGFGGYHRVLSRRHWSGRVVSRLLLVRLLGAFVPPGAPVVVGLDETLERRWGRRIAARGVYRDPVRSSHGHFVKASGLRWFSLMLLAPVPWAGRAGSVSTRAKADGASCTTSSGYAASRMASAAAARRR